MAGYVHFQAREGVLHEAEEEGVGTFFLTMEKEVNFLYLIL